MQIVDLNKKITFQMNAVVTDKYGNHINQWTDMFTLHGMIGGENGSEVNEAGVVVPKTTFTVTCRYNLYTRSVTAIDYRVYFDGHAYNITAIDHYNYRGQWIKFTCLREAME